METCEETLKLLINYIDFFVLEFLENVFSLIVLLLVYNFWEWFIQLQIIIRVIFNTVTFKNVKVSMKCFESRTVFNIEPLAF